VKPAPSILNRIVLLHLGAFAGISAAIIAAAFLLLHDMVDTFEESVLRGHAQTVSQYLSHDAGGWTLALPTDLAAAYRKGAGSFALAIVSDEGRTLFSSFPDGTRLGPPHGVGATGRYSHQRMGHSAFYRLILPKEGDGHTAWVLVGQNLASPDVIVDDVLSGFVARLVWIALPILAVIFLIDILLLRRQFRPVLAASQSAARIQPNSLPPRLSMTGLPREVLPLAEAFNQALERLEQALRAQREFTADAAHELRTPLAILRTAVDTTLDAETARRFHGDIDAMSHMLDQLLELAELEGEALAPSEVVDLTGLAAEVVALMAPLALAKDRTIELHAAEDQPLRARASRPMLLRALRNLVENAVRHAPPGGRVVVDVTAPASLAVRDNGPGIAPAERALVLKRFWRKNRAGQNAGLGLAIVAKIVELHGGKLEISGNPGGGAAIAIHLPEGPD